MAIRQTLWVLLGLCASGPAWAQEAPAAGCAARYQAAFAEAQKHAQQGQRKDSAAATWANNEVGPLFGPQPVSCEPGAYQAFLDGYQDLGRQAIRASAHGQNSLIYLAIAAIGRAPQRVPAAEVRGAAAAFQQVRTVLYAVADDVKDTAQIKQLLDAFDRSVPPPADAPQAAVPPAPAPAPAPVNPPAVHVSVPRPAPPTPGTAPGTTPPLAVQQVRVPQTALPPWAVVSIYEARELLRARDSAGAQAKLDSVLRWLETAP